MASAYNDVVRVFKAFCDENRLPRPVQRNYWSSSCRWKPSVEKMGVVVIDKEATFFKMANL